MTKKCKEYICGRVFVLFIVSYRHDILSKGASSPTPSWNLGNLFKELVTAWKVSVFGVFLVRIFLHLNWIRRETPYPSVFSLNAGMYGPGILQIRTLLTQCMSGQYSISKNPEKHQKIWLRRKLKKKKLKKNWNLPNFVFSQACVRKPQEVNQEISGNSFADALNNCF